MEEDKQGHPHLDVYLHMDRRVGAINDRLITVEIEKRHLADRMLLLENHFKTHMEREEEHWKGMSVEIASIRKLITRTVSAATGVVTTLGLLWMFGKDILDIWLKVNGG